MADTCMCHSARARKGRRHVDKCSGRRVPDCGLTGGCRGRGHVQRVCLEGVGGTFAAHLTVAMVRTILGASRDVASIARETVGTEAGAVEAMTIVGACRRAGAHGAVLASPARVTLAQLMRVALALSRAHKALVARDHDTGAHPLRAVHAAVAQGARACAIDACAMIRALVRACARAAFGTTPTRRTVAGTVVACALRDSEG